MLSGGEYVITKWEEARKGKEREEVEREGEGERE